MANKRVIDLPDLSQEVQEGQYILVDSSGGTGKMDLKRIVDDAGSFEPAGEYPDLYAGNLTTDKSQTDTAPYLLRRTGGNLSRIGERCYPVLVGASVAENQLCNGESVTVQNGHKYYLKKSGTESLGASAGTAITGLTSGSDMVIDLTQKLGSSIADYAYTLEQQTAGSGIAWLRSYDLITDEYKPYNTGTIESVEATAKVVRDENGENAVTYPLGSDTLRGIFKLDANNNLYADGDRKEADGTITRRYGIVDLGTLSWTYTASGSNNARFTARLNVKPGSTIITSGKLTPANSYGDVYYHIKDNTIIVHPSASQLEAYSSAYTTGTDFDTYLSGVMMVYELQTPTTETSTPFTSPQIVYPDGTEEFVTENNVPVGHETSYPYDLKGLVEGLIDVPDVPSNIGTYVLKATRSASGIVYNWVTG